MNRITVTFAFAFILLGCAVGVTLQRWREKRQPIQIEVLHHDSEYETITVKRDSLSRVPCNSRYIRVK